MPNCPIKSLKAHYHINFHYTQFDWLTYCTLFVAFIFTFIICFFFVLLFSLSHSQCLRLLAFSILLALFFAIFPCFSLSILIFHSVSPSLFLPHNSFYPLIFIIFFLFPFPFTFLPSRLVSFCTLHFREFSSISLSFYLLFNYISEQHSDQRPPDYVQQSKNWSLYTVTVHGIIGN